jgi:hypothetical protein
MPTSAQPPVQVPVEPPAPLPELGTAPAKLSLISWVLSILFLAIVIAGVGITYLYISGRKGNERAAVPSPRPPRASPIPSPLLEQNTAHEFLYMKGRNIFTYSQSQKREQQLTHDAGNVVTYSRPRWIDFNNVSFIRCERAGGDSKKPFDCSIVRQNIDGSSNQKLVTLTSRPNKNGIQTDADIQIYNWNANRTKLAYITHEPSSISPDFGEARIHSLDLTTNTDDVLLAIPLGGGRGGSLDDDTFIDYSPDDQKLLISYTAIYPNSNLDTDNGTLFVFNLTSKSLVWSMNKTWTTFGRWLNSEQIIAKQQSASTTTGAPWNLVKITLGGSRVDTLTLADNWFQFIPIGSGIYFWTTTAGKDTGVQLEWYDIDSKTRSQIASQVLPIAAVTTQTIAVQRLVACGAEGCGLDFYNGYAEDGIGLLNIVTKQVAPLEIGPVILSFYEFDVR